MSFSVEVKRELVGVNSEPCCQRAELSAFLHINSNLVISNRTMQLKIEIENATIAKHLFSALKGRYQVDIELSVEKKQNLRKNNVYILTVKEKAIEILEDLGIYSSKGMRQTPSAIITLKDCCAKRYLAGAFLAAGSINAPTTPNYHMEISSQDEELSRTILTLMNRFDLEAKMIKRRSRFVVYIKAADKIADFLRLTQAYNNTMTFEDERIQRDFRNSLTRLDNCEVANEVKSIRAGSAQLDAIYALIEHNRYSHLEDRLIEVGDLRMNHPEASLNELLDLYEEEFGVTLSKSGLQHRFKKIMDLASKLTDNK